MGADIYVRKVFLKNKGDKMIIEYTRVRESARPPERANPSDAGLDLFFNPEPEGFLPSPKQDSILIDRGQSVLLPTGYKFGIPHGYMLEIKKSVWDGS